MKLRCRICDICGKQIDTRDFQFWIKKPRIKYGFPSIEMQNYDVCSSCFYKMIPLIKEGPIDKITKLEDTCRILFNRCRAINANSEEPTCGQCNLKQECNKMHST